MRRISICNTAIPGVLHPIRRVRKPMVDYVKGMKESAASKMASAVSNAQNQQSGQPTVEPPAAPEIVPPANPPDEVKPNAETAPAIVTPPPAAAKGEDPDDAIEDPDDDEQPTGTPVLDKQTKTAKHQSTRRR